MSPEAEIQNGSTTITSTTPLSPENTSVAQALEIARDSPDGAANPTVVTILESEVNRIWGKVQSEPDSYLMSRDEFAVFNYFQNRFEGQPVAVAAKKRYWDSLRETNGN